MWVNYSKRVIKIVLAWCSFFLILGLSMWFFFGRGKPCEKYIQGAAFENKDWSLVTVTACYEGDEVRFDEQSNSLDFNLVFYDKYGFGHKYPVRMGWIDNQGKRVNPAVCLNEAVGNSCNFIDTSNLMERLKPGKVGVDVIVSERTGWDSMEYINNNSKFLNEFKNAVMGNGFFSVFSKRISLPVLMITLYE